MNINNSDLLKLRKDIERIRQHEADRRLRDDQAPNDVPKTEAAEQEVGCRVASAVRRRGWLEALLGPPTPSDESLAAIPEYVVSLLEVIREQPKFANWLLELEPLPPPFRKQQLEKMSFAMRIEDGDSPVAKSFDRLQDSSLFKAFCQVLRDEKLTAG